MKKMFERAAKHFWSQPYPEFGACAAVLDVCGTYTSFQPYKDALSAIFDGEARPTYWFGGGRPQYQLKGKAHEAAREERTYALLLAAHAYPDFI